MVGDFPETTVVRRRREIRYVAVKVIDKKKIGKLGTALKPAEDFRVHFPCVLPLEIVETAKMLIKRLDQRSAQQRAGKIAPERIAVVHVSVKAAGNAPALLAIIEIGNESRRLISAGSQNFRQRPGIRRQWTRPIRSVLMREQPGEHRSVGSQC